MFLQSTRVYKMRVGLGRRDTVTVQCVYPYTRKIYLFFHLLLIKTIIKGRSIHHYFEIYGIRFLYAIS